LVQALARDVIAEHAVKMFKATGLQPALIVHDELVYVVPDSSADEQLATLQSIMRQGVSWWPELVTWSEGDIAGTYGEAK
jgi:DNA polymerase I-like protein with 3'-5' exonuclease and polymerase domains